MKNNLLELEKSELSVACSKSLLEAWQLEFTLATTSTPSCVVGNVGARFGRGKGILGIQKVISLVLSFVKLAVVSPTMLWEFNAFKQTKERTCTKLTLVTYLVQS